MEITINGVTYNTNDFFSVREFMEAAFGITINTDEDVSGTITIIKRNAMP